MFLENQIAPNFRECVGHVAEQYKDENGYLPFSSAFYVENICSLSLIDRHNGLFALIGTLAVAAFTFTLWQTTSEQAKLTRESITLAREEFSSTHRPEIRVKHVWLTSDIWKGSPIKIDLVVVNVGGIPAVLREYKFSCLILPVGQSLPDKPAFKATFSADQTPIESGRTLHIPDPTDGQVLTSDDLTALLGGARLNVFGVVEYQDEQFRGIRTTAFARILGRPMTGAASVTNPGRFSVNEDPDYEYQD